MELPTDHRKLQTIQYKVHKFSSYISYYHPIHVLQDEPLLQHSRWSSSTASPQFLTLTFAPSVVKSVTFGKYQTQHACNLKRFVIEASYDDKIYHRVLDSGLHNDERKETFTLKTYSLGIPFPTRFLRIIPKETFEHSVSFSIWYLMLHGTEDTSLALTRVFQEHLERNVLLFASPAVYNAKKLLIDSVKNRTITNQLDLLHGKCAFNAYASRLLPKVLWTESRVRGQEEYETNYCDSETTQAMRVNLINDGDEYKRLRKLIHADVNVFYTQVELSVREVDVLPPMRGGHQLVDCNGVLYLYGGYNGKDDLNDMWMYNGRWHCISEDVANEGGPSARSCHKMCYDTLENALYVFGKYCIEPESGVLYRYCLNDFHWEIVSNCTEANGGPMLVYDFEMVYSAKHKSLFVYGGRYDKQGETHYEGLYRYRILEKRWKCVRDDSICYETSPDMRGRSGFSMVLSADEKRLFVFGGQRHTEFCCDLLEYDINTDTVVHMERCLTQNLCICEDFSQRATRYGSYFAVLGGNNAKVATGQSLSLYDPEKHTWQKLYEVRNWYETRVPPPRYAHQLAYSNGKAYMFGGNAGKKVSRLNDFWEMELVWYTGSDVHSELRTLWFSKLYNELCLVDKKAALHYLRNGDFAGCGVLEKDYRLARALFVPEEPMTDEDYVSRVLECMEEGETMLSMEKFILSTY